MQVSALPQERDVPVQVYGLGTVEAHTLSKIGFRISGTLTKLNADHGDRVRKGEVLALLDSAEQKNRVEKAASGVERARAAILIVEAGEQRAKANLKHKERLNLRRDGLVSKGYVSVEDAEKKRIGVEVAHAEVKLAQADVVAARAALREALAQHELEKVLLSQHELIAPYDAQIVTRHKELGSVQLANEPLFTLVDTDTLWARVHVDEERAGSLRIGQPAEIRLRSVPGKHFRGRVKRLTWRVTG